MMETLTSQLTPQLTPLVAVIIAALATYASRFLGVLLSGRIQVEDPIFEWVTAVAYALLSGLVLRMILMPVGMLESVDLIVRAGGAVAALAVFFLSRQNLLLGILTGVLILVVFG